MLSRRVSLWTMVIREMRGVASLGHVFAVALLLAWLLSGGRAFSLFQSPTEPPTPTETPEPTQPATKTEVMPTSTPLPSEAPPTATPPVPSPSPTAEFTATPAAPPTSRPAEATLTPTVEGPAPPTVTSAEVPPSEGAMSLWPWMFLGLSSLAAIAAGVFLLRREAYRQEGER